MRPCRHGLIRVNTVFHVVASCRANPAMVVPAMRDCRIAQRIARVPRRARGAHTRSSCSRNVSVWQVCSRHIQRRTVPPDLHRDPGPGRVDHLHHHTTVTVSKSPHNPGGGEGRHPAQRLQDSMSSTRPHSRRTAATRWKPSKPTSGSHRSQRSSDTEQQQVGSDTAQGP